MTAHSQPWPVQRDSDQRSGAGMQPATTSVLLATRKWRRAGLFPNSDPNMSSVGLEAHIDAKHH